jgi:hypothetical protein
VQTLLGGRGGLWWLIAFGSILAGSILAGMGILGGYIARIYDETKQRPLYIVADTKGFPQEDEPEQASQEA